MKFKEYPESKRMYEEAKDIFAMGVGSQVQSFARPHPLYMTRGCGSKLYDVDGNEYIDYLLNYGPLILGHCGSPAPTLRKFTLRAIYFHSLQ